MTSPLRVLNVGHYYHVKGGSDSYMLALEALLQAHGHEVAPFASRHPHNRPSRWQAYFPEGLDTQRSRFRDAVRFIYSRQARDRLDRMLENFPADIAHLHIYYGQLTPAIFGALRRHGIPTLQSLHEYKLTCPVYSHFSNGAICEDCEGSNFYRALPKRCNRGSLGRTLASVTEAYVSRWLGDTTAVDQFIAVSEFMRQQMLKFGTLNPDRISVLHNFVDPARFTPQAEAGDYLLYFGRLAGNKGLETLIRAIAPVRGARLVIAGDGELRGACQALADELGASQISFVGFRQGEELTSLIRNASCVVLPSEWYENCPMSVLEAFAHAKPVIGAQIGGIPELIDVGRDGWLFPPGDEVALRECIEHAVSHVRRLPDMGMTARRKIEERFSPEVHYRQLLDIYRKAQRLSG
jgi:glycosyltransferase involved in cell wall biosynthesis